MDKNIIGYIWIKTLLYKYGQKYDWIDMDKNIIG